MPMFPNKEKLESRKGYYQVFVGAALEMEYQSQVEVFVDHPETEDYARSHWLTTYLEEEELPSEEEIEAEEDYYYQSEEMTY